MDLNQKEQKIHKKLEELSTKDLYLEAYSRYKNIKFNHIPETCGEETEVLRAFVQNELGHVYASTVEIQWVHPPGKERNDRPLLRYKLNLCKPEVFM